MDCETVEEADDDSWLGEAVVAWMNRDTHSEEALSGEAWSKRVMKFVLMNDFLCDVAYGTKWGSLRNSPR
jgi:hypothetical protein